jgi:uncharacterized membrane protein
LANKRNRNRNLARQQGGQPQIIGQAQVVVSGPLPASAELDNYERILPGLANRIVTQFEAEGAHRRDMESRYLKLQGTGLAIGTVLFVLWILASFVLIETGHEVSGVVSGVIAIIGLMTNTVVGYRRRHQ